MSIFHDITDQKHRSKPGALRCGDDEKVSIYAPEANASGGELVIYGDEYNSRYALQREGDYLTTSIIAPEKPQVLWYHFLLHGFPYDFFCGAAENGIDSKITNDIPQSFQLTVYSADFDTPEWFRNSVMYQVFPDRFAGDETDTAKNGIEYHRSLGRKIRCHDDWNEPVCWEPEHGEKDYYPNDYFGGTLKGITNKLPYLKKLGVGVVYLNPIFEADSNHRYNTADYMKIDPVLGTESDFTELCTEAEKLGIRLMLDGVFSHTGSDSVYFNRENRYSDLGAYQGKESPYYKWFDFRKFPDEYRAWWGFNSLPEVDETIPEWQEFIYGSKSSVVRHWLSAGAGGWRLDVADELPDDILEGIYAASKKEKPESVIMGEVWEDPTVKESYGIKRKYALGGMLDTVMNYPLRTAIIDYAKGALTAKEFGGFLLKQRLHYPEPMYFALMNLLSSHDVPRIRTALGTDIYMLKKSREEQATFKLDDKTNKRAKKLQKLSAVLQFSLPGVPCIYYGDEHGMEGAFDPFDRAPFLELDNNLMGFYMLLSEQRNESNALRSGEIGVYAPNDNVLFILRVSECEAVIIAVNRGEAPYQNEVNIHSDFKGCLGEMESFINRKVKIEVEPLDYNIVKI